MIRDITSTQSLTKKYIQEIVSRENEIFRILRQGNPSVYRTYLEGLMCALLFFQKSTRTYTSFDNALRILGSTSIEGFRDAAESAVAKGESLFHTVDTFVGQGTGTNFIIIRSANEGAALWAQISAFRSFAKKVRHHARRYRDFPNNLILPIVFNGGSGMQSHPSQLLLDCATIQHQFGKINDISLGVCNDIGGSRVASSQIDVAAMLNWNMHFSAMTNGELSSRQKYSLVKNAVRFKTHESTSSMLSDIDMLYVNRFQFNLRGKNTGEKAGDLFSSAHPRISLELVQPYNLPILHARPIDKNAGEIHPNIFDHPLDLSGVQSDHGVPTRMAMCMYAIDNGLFTLDGIIRTLVPEKVGFLKEDLSSIEGSSPSREKYISSFLSNGFVIDHVPLGCAGVMVNLIARLYPDISVVMASNIKGRKKNSLAKDVIKMHVPRGFKWTNELDAIVALFTEHTAEKSCRVSRFVNGKRMGKWQFRSGNGDKSLCANEKCITRPEQKEEIHFTFRKEVVSGITVDVCPFCETPQPSIAQGELLRIE